MQENTPVETPAITEVPNVIETTTSITADPIYRHKDGRIFTKEQLISKMGVTEDRIKDGLAKGMITLVGDTEDPSQQFKHKDGRVFSVKDFADMGVDKNRIADGIEKGMLTPIEKKNQNPTPAPTQKQEVSTPPSNVSAAGESVSTTSTETPTTTVEAKTVTETPTEKTTTEEVTQEPPVRTIFDEAKDYETLKNKKKTVKQEFVSAEPGVVETVDVDVDDTDAQDQAKKMKAAAGDKEIDYDVLNDVNKIYETTPVELLNITKESLQDEYLNNRALFNSHYHGMKWATNFSKTLASKFNEEEAARQYYEIEGADTDAMDNSKSFPEFSNKIANSTNQLIAMANLGDYDNKKELLSDRQASLAYSYANWANNNPQMFEADPLAKTLDSENKILAWHFIHDLSPEELGKYKAALLTEQDVASDANAQLGRQKALKDLEQIGLNIRKQENGGRLKELSTQLAQDVEILNGFVNDAKSDPANAKGYIDNYNEYLPDYNKRMEEYNRLTALDKKFNTDAINLNDSDQYNLINEQERQSLLQELTGQRHGGIVQPLLKLGEAVYNTLQAPIDMIYGLVGSDKDNNIRFASAMGINEKLANETYVRKKNMLGGGENMLAMSPEFKAQYDDIMENKSLSDADKKDKVYNLIVDNPDGIRVDAAGAETNLTLNSIWYGMTNLAADLAPYLAMEYFTGGAATEGVAPSVLRKFSSSFISAFTTGFHQSYLDAISRGSVNPYADAMRSATISSLAMAGAGTPDLMRKIIGTKSVVGKMINKMTDKEILEVLRTEPKAITAFKKAYNFGTKAVESTLEGFKGGTKMVALTTAAQALNDKMYGDVKDFSEYVDQGKIEVLKFTMFGGLTGTLTRGFTEKIGDMTKVAIYEAAENPDKFLIALDKKIKDNTISKEEADQVRNNIELAKNVYKATNFNDANGKPLNDASKRNLLVLKMKEADLNGVLQNEGLSKDLKKKTENRLLNIKDEINDLINGNYQPPVERNIEVLTKGKILVGDNIENKKGQIGKVIQVSDNGNVIVRDPNGRGNMLWKEDDIVVKKPEVKPEATAETTTPEVTTTPEAVTEEKTVEPTEEKIAKPIPVFGPPSPQKKKVVPAPPVKKAPEPDSDIMVGDVIDKAGSYNGQKGVFYLDGPTVVFKAEGTGKEYDLGYINDIKDTPINQFGIKHEESVVKLNEDGTFNIRGNTLRNGYSDPTQAINRDADGNIQSVTLDMPNGTKRTFRGNVAEDIAYQIHLQEITKDNATATEFENFINEPESKQQIDNATVPATAEAAPAETNEPVQREALTPATTEPAVTAITDEETARQMKPFADKMVEIEREFENRGYTIDTNYDNEITVIDKDGDALEPEDLPKELRTLAADYERATAKLGEVNDRAREIALGEARKVVETEAEVVEPESNVNKKLQELGNRQVPKGPGSWRNEFNKEKDAFRKSSILRAIADSSKNEKELNDIKEAAKDMPDENNIIHSVDLKLKSLGIEVVEPEKKQIAATTTAEDKVKSILAQVGGDINKLSGDANAAVRQAIIEGLTGEKVSKAKAGINKVKEVVEKHIGVTPDSEAGKRDQIKKWAKGEKIAEKVTAEKQKELEPTVREVTSEKQGKRLSEFKKGDVVYRNYLGEYEEWEILDDSKPVWKLKNTATGEVENWTANDYVGFILKEGTERKKLTSEEHGENLSEFERGDTVYRNYDGKYEEYEILDSSKGVWKLKSNKTGAIEDWNADSNGGFILKESKSDRILKTLSRVPENIINPKGIEQKGLFFGKRKGIYDATKDYPELLKYNDKNINTASAADLWNLIRMYKPSDYGFKISKKAIESEFNRRGIDIFKELGLPTDGDAMYVTETSGVPIKLSDILEKSDLASVAEDWLPVLDYKKEIENIENKIEVYENELKYEKDKSEIDNYKHWIKYDKKAIAELKNGLEKGLSGAKETKEIKGGEEVNFKTSDNKDLAGIKIEVPGLEKLDTILVQDGMNYKLYELSTGLIVGESQMAAFPAEAVKEIASNIPANIQDRLLNKIYQSEYDNRYNIAGEKKGITVINESPAYNAFKQAKIAEAENKPFIHDEKTRNELLKLAEEARKEGVEVGADVITTWANNKVGKVYTIEEAKKVLDAYRKKKDLEERKSKDIPYPEGDRVKREPTEESLINAIQQGYKRDRWNKLPDEIKRAALEAWKKETAIYNKYGYYPSSWKNIEGFYGTLLSVGKYIGATLSKDESKKSERIQEELQVMKDNFKRIDELYKQEGFDVLKSTEGEAPKPLSTTEVELPQGAKSAFDKIKNRQQQQSEPTEGVGEIIPAAKNNENLVKAIEVSKRKGISDYEYQKSIQKANELREEAKKLESQRDADSQSKRYELLDEANRIEKEAISKIAPFDAVVETTDEMLSVKSNKFNEAKCRELSKKHQEEYGGKYEEVEVTNQDGTKVKHAIVVHDGYVYEPQSNAVIKTEVFNDFFDTKLGEKKPSLKTGTEVREVKVSDLKTDEAAFQNREGLNEQKVKSIVENYNPSEFDPIVYWTDENGNKFTLNHHRFAAAQQLGLESIPARPLTYPAGHPKAGEIVPPTDKAEAIDYAINRSNANRSMETAIERAKALRKLKESGASKEKVEKFLEAEGKNKTKVQNFAALNPNGKTIEALRRFGDSEDVQTQKATEQTADWIGEARRTINGLTDVHENELFDFLFDKSKSKRITTKADFLQKVRSLVNPLIPEEPLNIARFEYKTEGESAYDAEVEGLKEKIAERQTKINEINERFNNPNAKGYISTESKDYAEARKVADKKIAELEAERKALQRQLEVVYANKGKFTGGAASGSLFSYKKTAPEDFEDYVTGVQDMIKEAPEKSLQQVQAEVANYFDNHTPAFKKLIEQAYNEAKNNATDRIVKKVVLKEINKGFLNIGSTIFDNELQLLDKAKQLSGSRFNAVDKNNAGFETRDGKPIGFNYDTDQVARERFDFSKLKKIGEGSDRIVFDLGNGKVLKVAKTARGLEQNIYEGDGYLDFIPEVFERGLNYVVTENIDRIKGTDLVPVYDIQTNDQIGTTTAGKMFADLKRFNQRDFTNYNPELQTVLEKYGFQDARGYDLLYGDFNAARNWGYRDGKPYLIDAGTLGGVEMLDRYRGVQNLSDPDFRKIYTESKRLKREYADSDRYTKFHYDENGEILGFTHGGHIYLNGEKITAKTTMEEAGHIWVNYVKEKNGTLYHAGLKKVLNSQYLKDVMSSDFYKREALKQGKEGSKAYNEYMQEEALAKAISDEGAKFITDAQRIDFNQWVKQMWNNIKSAFGIRDLSADQVAKLTLKDFAKMAAADVFAEAKAPEPAIEVPKGETPVVTTETTTTPEGERVTEERTITTKNPYLYEGTTERKRGLYNHLMDADNVSQETKDFLLKNGISYEVANNAQAELMAEDILKSFGLRDALHIARGSDVHASVRSAIFAKAIDAAYMREMNAKTPQEKMKAAQDWKDLVTEYAAQLTAGGQFTAYAEHFYRTSPMGFVMRENAEREERFNEWTKGKEKTLEEFWNEIKNTAEGKTLVSEEAAKLRKAEKEAERKERDKKIDDFFDKLKINPKNTYGFVIPPTVLNLAIEGMRLAVKAGDRISDVVQKAIDEISAKVGDNWNKEAFRKDYEEMLGKAVPTKKESSEATQLRKRIEGLEKQIENLKDRIAAGGEPAKKKEVKFSDNPEVQALIEERDRLRKENEDLLRDAKQGKYSDEAKIKAAKQRIVDAIKETQRKIDENDLAIKKKTNPTDAELIAYREKQKALRKELEAMRKEAQEGKYDPAQMAIAEAKRKQARIDELNRRINENDFSAETIKLKKQKTQLDLELEEVKKKYDEARKQSPEWQEKKAAQFLEKFKSRLKGLSEKQQKEIVARSVKKLAETGALNYDEFRKIVAETMGLKDLTPAEVKEIESLTETINSVEAAEDALINNPTEANIKALDKARQDAMLASLKLYNKMHRQADIPRTFSSIITGSLLGLVTNVMNVAQNIVMQSTMRVPKTVITQLLENGVYAGSWIGNKMTGSRILKPSTNIFLAQKGYFKGAGKGLKRGWFNFYKGTQERDYFGKTSYQSSLSPKEAVKDLKMYFNKEKFLTKTEVFERAVRATLGWQPDFILRTMGFGDRPFRWAAEGAAAIQIAKLELNLVEDNEVNAFMAAPKKFAYATLVKQGVSKAEAELRAAEMEDRIIEAGNKAVLEQENALSWASKKIDAMFVSKKDDNVFKKAVLGAAAVGKTATLPFIKIPANVYWQMFKVANPEIALLQALYHGGRSWYESSKAGDNAAAKRQIENAKDNLGTAIFGFGVSVAISSLVANGYVRPENDDETKLREKEGEKVYEKSNQLNWGRLMGGEDYWIDLKWFGPIGATMSVRAQVDQKKKEDLIKGKPASDSYMDDFADRFSIAEMASLNNLVFDQAGRTVAAIKGGEKPLKVWTINNMNLAGNIFTGATYTQISKAMLPVVPRLKGEGVMEEFKNNQKQRNVLFRMFAGMPPAKISIWGEPMKQDNSFTGVLANMLGFQESDANKFGAILYYDAEKTGDMRFFPSPVTDKVTIDGKEIQLTQDQKDELATYVGQARKMLVGAFVYDCAFPYRVPVKGQPAIKLKYSDKEMTTEDKINALQMIYEYGKQIGFTQFQQLHKEFAPAKLTAQQIGEQAKKEAYGDIFKIDIEKKSRAAGKAIPAPTKEQELQSEIEKMNEEYKKSLQEYEDKLQEKTKENEELQKPQFSNENPE